MPWKQRKTAKRELEEADFHTRWTPVIRDVCCDNVRGPQIEDAARL